MTKLHVVVLAVATLSGPTIAEAQALYGSLVGSVVDPGNAAVVGATVQATQTGTNQSRSIATNDAGGYSFPALTVGAYDVTISKEGFQTFTQKNLLLTINSVQRRRGCDYIAVGRRR